MLRGLTAALTIALAMSCARADSGIRRVPCGYQQVAVDTATPLTIPAACAGTPSMVVITAEGQAVRYRDDRTAPTAAVGMPLAVGQVLNYEGTISALRFISQTSGGKVNALFYR
jgi:hypothetical protein